MPSAPVLANFAVRLAFGMLLACLLSARDEVPPRFFRTLSVVILGVLVLAGLDQARSTGVTMAFWILVAGACCSYLASVSWGLGLSRIGGTAEVFGALAAAAWLAKTAQAAGPLSWGHAALSQGTSGFLMGTSLAAMLLGHYYLITPAMSIEP